MIRKLQVKEKWSFKQFYSALACFDSMLARSRYPGTARTETLVNNVITVQKKVRSCKPRSVNPAMGGKDLSFISSRCYQRDVAAYPFRLTPFDKLRT